MNVQLPHGIVIQNHLSGNLKLGSLPHVALHAHVFKDLHKWSLLSVGKLCDAGITVIFTSDKAKAILDGKLVLVDIDRPPQIGCGPSTSHPLSFPALL
jgi:hypothetical protein